MRCPRQNSALESCSKHLIALLLPLAFVTACLTSGIASAAGDASAEDAIGKWAGEGIEMRIAPGTTPGAFVGEIMHRGNRYAMQATADQASHLTGRFSVGEEQYSFTSVIEGETLTLKTADATYRLQKRKGESAANPLRKNNGGMASGHKRVAFEAKQGPEGGEVWITDKIEGPDGGALVKNTLGALGEYLDSPPRLLTGFTDAKTGEAQGFFSGKLHDKPIEGIITAIPSPEGKDAGKVGVVYDSAERFARTRPGLMKLLAGEMPEINAPSPGKLKPVRLPDGSATIDLPEGWQLTPTSTKGSLEANGPNGEALVLGLALPVTVPAGLGNGPFILPYMAPEQAIVAIMPSLNYAARQSGGAISENVRVVSSQRVAYEGGQAAFMVWQQDTITRNRRTEMTLYGLVITAPAGPSAWMFYASAAMAPTVHFKDALPAMLEAWQSWKIDDKVFVDRMKQTFARMQETTKILQDVHSTQQKAFDKANAAWDMYLSELASVYDARTGQYKTMSLYNNAPTDAGGEPKGPDAQGKAPEPQSLNKWIEDQNKQAGFNRYKQMKPGEG